MDSPMGLRGVICERFGWTYDYLLDGIPWMDVHLMMKDAPAFIPDDKGKNDDNGKNNTPNNPIVKNDSPEEKSDGEKLNSFLSKYL